MAGPGKRRGQRWAMIAPHDDCMYVSKAGYVSLPMCLLWHARPVGRRTVQPARWRARSARYGMYASKMWESCKLRLMVGGAQHDRLPLQPPRSKYVQRAGFFVDSRLWAGARAGCLLQRLSRRRGAILCSCSGRGQGERTHRLHDCRTERAWGDTGTGTVSKQQQQHARSAVWRARTRVRLAITEPLRLNWHLLTRNETSVGSTSAVLPRGTRRCAAL